MKKALYIITKSNWGGAQRYVFDLASALPQNEWEAVVALGGTGFADASEGLLGQKLREQNIRTIFVPSFMRDISLTREWRALRELAGIIEKEMPQIVHLNSSKAGGIGALAARWVRWKSGVPMKIVFTSHGLPWDEDRNILSRGLIWLASWFTFLLCDEIIVISTNNFVRARRIPFCAHKIHLVYNGIAPMAFLSRDEAREKLGIQQDALCIGTIAELTWNKGVHMLIRAASILKRKNISFFLAILGDGEDRGFLEELVQEQDVEDRVLFAGFVEKGSEYLKAFDIFALASVKEGLPYVLMEAGQAALPCVGSQISGITDILADSVSGLLFESKNKNELANQLQKLIEDAGLRQSMGEALQKRVEQEFSLEHCVEETVKLYSL